MLPSTVVQQSSNNINSIRLNHYSPQLHLTPEMQVNCMGRSTTSLATMVHDGLHKYFHKIRSKHYLVVLSEVLPMMQCKNYESPTTIPIIHTQIIKTNIDHDTIVISKLPILHDITP